MNLVEQDVGVRTRTTPHKSTMFHSFQQLPTVSNIFQQQRSVTGNQFTSDHIWLRQPRSAFQVEAVKLLPEAWLCKMVTFVLDVLDVLDVLGPIADRH